MATLNPTVRDARREITSIVPRDGNRPSRTAHL